MSTYAVFGMTLARAVADARKRTEAAERRDGKLVQLSEAEWISKCNRIAEETMAGTAVVRLSDVFDAPHYAEQFLQIAKHAGGRSLHIRAHCWNGEIDKKTGKKRLEWVEVGSDRERQIKLAVEFGKGVAACDGAEVFRDCVG